MVQPRIVKRPRLEGHGISFVDSAKANRAKCTEHGLTTVLLPEDNEVADATDAYHSPGNASAVVVYAGGTIGSPIAAVADADTQSG